MPGRDLLIADKPKDFANALLRLLEDPQQRRQLGEAGRAYIENHHHWDDIAARLEAIYREVVNPKPDLQRSQHLQAMPAATLNGE